MEPNYKVRLIIRALQIPLSKRYTPQDSWNEAWAPFWKLRCQEFLTDPPPQSAMSESEQAEIRQYCNEMQSSGD